VQRQVWLAVFWQTTTLVSIALLVGVPLGALLGRFAWNVFAKDLGAIAEQQVAWIRAPGRVARLRPRAGVRR
jgi:hypothetical protein